MHRSIRSIRVDEDLPSTVQDASKVEETSSFKVHLHRSTEKRYPYLEKDSLRNDAKYWRDCFESCASYVESIVKLNKQRKLKRLVKRRVQVLTKSKTKKNRRKLKAARRRLRKFNRRNKRALRRLRKIISRLRKFFRKLRLPKIPKAVRKRIATATKNQKIVIRSLLPLYKRIKRKPSKKDRKRRLKFEGRFLKVLAKRAQKSKNGFYFIAFDKGLDGLPLLFMHKKKIRCGDQSLA